MSDWSVMRINPRLHCLIGPSQGSERKKDLPDPSDAEGVRALRHAQAVQAALRAHSVGRFTEKDAMPKPQRLVVCAPIMCTGARPIVHGGSLRGVIATRKQTCSRVLYIRGS